MRLISALIAMPACLLVACVDPASEADLSASEGAQHCVVSPAGQVSCYGTFTEAISVATGGEIDDAPADPKVALADETFAARLNEIGQRVREAGVAATGTKASFTSEVVIGISYKDANYD